MPAEPTPKDTLFQDGTAKLYRFRGSAAGGAAKAALPVLLVPSLINRWYVLDLRQGASVASALVEAGLDVFCLDWGVPNDEDRYLEWDDLVHRLGRMVRRVQREAAAPGVGVLGYCMGGTLSSIYAALEPERIAALVNLAGPVDFSEAGFLGHMTNPRWFDPEAIASAGNMRAEQMQAGFVALRPTAQIAKWVSFLDKLDKPEKLEAFRALDEWASANISFPAPGLRALHPRAVSAKRAGSEAALRGRSPGRPSPHRVPIAHSGDRSRRDLPPRRSPRPRLPRRLPRPRAPRDPRRPRWRSGWWPRVGSLVPKTSQLVRGEAGVSTGARGMVCAWARGAAGRRARWATRANCVLPASRVCARGTDCGGRVPRRTPSLRGPRPRSPFHGVGVTAKEADAL